MVRFYFVDCQGNYVRGVRDMTTDFNDRETATLGLCLRLIESIRSRHRVGVQDSADKAELWLERNYGILQRMAAPSILRKMK